MACQGHRALLEQRDYHALRLPAALWGIRGSQAWAEMAATEDTAGAEAVEAPLVESRQWDARPLPLCIAT